MKRTLVAIAIFATGVAIGNAYGPDRRPDVRIGRAVKIVAPATAPAPTVAPAPDVAEDDPGFNCQTMGNRTCGPNWVNWGEYDGHPDCLANVGDTTYIACSDGFVTTS